MIRCADSHFFNVDYVFPVPLHNSRLRARGYNQSYILARALGKTLNIRIGAHILKRKRKTPSQAGKSASGRKRNVAGAFDIPKRHHSKLKGKSVLLVDDVFTTGATIEACARSLKAAGAAKVNVITLTRVVSARNPII
jgi:ComF family protein